ncbi:MAG: NADH-quinone oxidoreductase subunit A [Bacteroidota bacterium]
MIATEQIAFLEILYFIAGALLLVGIGALLAFLLRPQRPNTAKLQTYESGEMPTGGAWGKFNTRFYVIAIAFMLFEVETILLFPWATVWAHPALNKATGGLWARYTAMSGTLFIALLALGLAYVWRQGYLLGIPPTPPPANAPANVPKSLYEQVNSRYASATNKATTHTE